MMADSLSCAMIGDPRHHFGPNTSARAEAVDEICLAELSKQHVIIVQVFFLGGGGGGGGEW